MTPTPDALPVTRVDSAAMGGHVQHWQSFGLTGPAQVPVILQEAVDHCGLARGLQPADDADAAGHWCLQDDRSMVGIAQVIAVQNGQPVRLLNAFPLVHSPHRCKARLLAVSHCPDTHDAVLTLQVGDTRLFAFDPLYAINAGHYVPHQVYEVTFGALAHSLEQASPDDHLEITDPEAIRHHRGLTALLAEHPGLDDATLAARLANWQPPPGEPLLPVVIDLRQMVAYLHGEQHAQEDEAWIAGCVLGSQEICVGAQKFAVYDVVIDREQPDQPVVIRVAQALKPVDGPDSAPTPKHSTDQNGLKSVLPFTAGDYIRGNVWLQVHVCAMTAP